MINPSKPVRILAVLLISICALFSAAAPAWAQSETDIVDSLDDKGYYLGPAAYGDPAEFKQLARRSTSQRWYYISVDSVSDADGLAKRIKQQVARPGNVLLYNTGQDYEEIILESLDGDATAEKALAPFGKDWSTPSELMGLIVDEYEHLTSVNSSTSTAPTGSTQQQKGSGFNIFWIVLPALLGFFVMMMFQQRAAKKRRAKSIQETAAKMRVEIVKELSHLANDVLVLNSAIDVSENEKAIAYYREAAAAYIEISDELPDVEELQAELERADLEELAELASEVSTARWQMDAAEALIENKPVPPKPEVTTPEPEPAKEVRPPIPPQRVPQQRQQPRVQYNRSGRRNGAGLIDILIAGATMMNQRGYRSRRPRAQQPRMRRSNSGGFILGSPRPRRGSSGGGVFGTGNSPSRSNSGGHASRSRRRPNSSTRRRRAR